jgi:hypothetical protein
MQALPINYLGDESILTNPLYLKWSLVNFGDAKTALADLKNDLQAVKANQDNLKIASYLATLIRIAGVI